MGGAGGELCGSVAEVADVAGGGDGGGVSDVAGDFVDGFSALRDCVCLTASDSVCWDSLPFDAESADEAASIVRMVGESVGVAPDLLCEHV